jgi:hypothetical protein
MDTYATATLIHCLDDWCTFDDGLCLYYPSNRYVSAGSPALINLMRSAV